MRREHEPDDDVGAGRERGLGRLGDARRPVLHAGEDRQPELALERGARLLGDRVERVVLLDAEAAVALDEVLEVLRRDRPAAADVGVVRGHVRRGARASRTPSARPRRSYARLHGARLHELGEARDARPGSVCGRIPWPRLKMCPLRPRARSSTSSAAASRRSHGASSAAGSRLPCTPRSPTSSQPSSSGMRQSSPITSPSIWASSVVVPVPKWIVGTSTASRMRALYGATNSRVVGRREHADPRVEELDHVGARVRPARARSARSSPRASSISACHARGSRYMNAFTFAKSRLGFPSIR